MKKSLSLVKSAARRISPFPLLASKTRSPPPPPPVPVSSARPLACIFMKSLFRTTIHRDEQRTMTVHRRRRCGGGGCAKKGKKKERDTAGEKRKGRLVSIREGEKGWREREEGGGEVAKECTYAQREPHIQPPVPAFVRFFVMTVDETMTYFSGFSLPGVPRGSAIHAFPASPRPSVPPARVHAASGASWAPFPPSPPFFHRGVSCALFLPCVSSRVILRTSLSLNPPPSLLPHFPRG